MSRTRLSVRARWLWGVGGASVVLAGVVAVLVFQPWLLLVDVLVDDDIPLSAPTSAPTPTIAPADETAAASAAPMPAAPAGPVDLASGSFLSHEHDTSGSVRLIQHPDGSRQLAIEALSTTNGPDVHVWPSAGPVVEGFDGWFTAAGHDHVDLGPIKGNLGDQLYDIPADVDLDVFRTVDLWCVQFAVSFGAAALI